ncbi:MAG TPA: 4-alpha-glucanotransferase, partial [Anaeromyxobacteraceae bacterium]|nr:4-alpha-glucanotransferase [Anaeromyxobacteraceae bacterium]
MRQAGCLLPLFSIRSTTGWGLGEIPDLVSFARWARAGGFSVLQVLPVHEASRGQSSPYSALTAFAIDPVYAAVDALEDFQAAGGREALSAEESEELAALRSVPAVPWQRVRALKARALRLAFQAFLDSEWRRRTARARQLEQYAREHEGWLDDYALFVTLHDGRGGRAWTEWEAPLRDRDPGALSAVRARHSEELLFQTWLQWQLDLQWHAARRACHEAGVALMGDLPFMVAGDSADVWSRPFDFRLDARVGVPPDQYSETGQDWGLPVYRWDQMAKGGFAWMNERARRTGALYDLYRVDHVVGLYRTYYREAGQKLLGAFTPPDEPSQVKNGEKMLALLAQGARIVAEDLGVIPDFVRTSLKRLQVPGYRVLRWEKDGAVYRDPAKWPPVSLGTTGTHDTDALADWFEGLPDDERAQLLKIPGLARLRDRAP